MVSVQELAREEAFVFGVGLLQNTQIEFQTCSGDPVGLIYAPPREATEAAAFRLIAAAEAVDRNGSRRVDFR